MGSLLIFVIGNDARGDDGVAWRLAENISGQLPANTELEYRYQLQVEDAMLVSQYDKVFFADATHEMLPGGYIIRPCLPSEAYYYSSHQQSPEAILYLAKCLYGKCPEAFTVAITGYHWELGQTLSSKAKKNLEGAILELSGRIGMKLNSEIIGLQ